MRIEREDIIDIIGEKIKIARKNKGYTQETATEEMDVSKDLLRNIENGRSLGSVETLLNICNLFEITPNYLFSELLTMKEDIVDQELHSEFNKLNEKQKELIKILIKYLKEMD